MTHPGNDASAGLLSSLGFAREGVLRSFRATPTGPREDVIVWSLLPIDWSAS